MEYYPDIKKWTSAICKNMRGTEDIMPSEMSDRVRQKLYYLTYMLNEKNL